MRAFLAVTPPATVLDAVEALPRPGRPGVRWTTRDQWHVTLRFLGDIDDPAPIEAALRAVALPPATMRIGPAIAALGRHVVMLPVEGLDELAAVVIEATASFGQPPEQRPFRGHLTLARVRQGSAARLTGAPLLAECAVDAVELFRSDLHPDGARYELLAAVPL